MPGLQPLPLVGALGWAVKRVQCSVSLVWRLMGGQPTRAVRPGESDPRIPRTSIWCARPARPTKEMGACEDDAEDNELRDDGWNEQARDETPMQRLDRNWADLLQELRVVQTGVQLLTGFLLTLPFQARFEQLSAYERTVYLITVALSVAATGFLIAPVSLHRTLFRRHARELMVTVSHRLAIIGLVLLGAAIVGVVLLIFDVVAGTAAGIVAAAAALVLLVSLWAGLPWIARAGSAAPLRSDP